MYEAGAKKTVGLGPALAPRLRLARFWMLYGRILSRLVGGTTAVVATKSRARAISRAIFHVEEGYATSVKEIILQDRTPDVVEILSVVSR